MSNAAGTGSDECFGLAPHEHFALSLRSVWTTASIWETETFYQRGYRRNKTLSTLCVTPKHEATPRTTWASSRWPSELFNPSISLFGSCLTVSQLLRMFFPHSNCEVLTTLTPDSGRILSKLHAVQPKGKICFCTGIRVAHVSRVKVWREAAPNPSVFSDCVCSRG